LFFSVFPPMSNSETPTLDSHLSIVNITAAPNPVIEGDTVHIYVAIKNIGSTNISAGQQIIIAVKVDNEQTTAASLTDSLGLLKNQQRTENLTWVAALGSSQQRLLHVTVTYLGGIEAVTEAEIRVSERKTDLLFVTTPSISGMNTIGKPITISALVKNSGRNTTQGINVSLRIDKVLKQWYIKSGGLIRGESFSVSFYWTPLAFGVHTINLSIDPKGIISEELKTNNYYETTTSIIPWWNTSWHYRRVYNVTGAGNISLSLNFTMLLTSLQVENKTFENATITIVRYHTNGTMVVVNKSWFNESSVFNNRTNARGTLSWVVPGPSLYGVYFDAKENRGTRRQISETLNLTGSGTAAASVVSTQGWWPEFDNPFETYYLLNTALLVQLHTTAFAKNLSASFFCNGTAQFTMSFNSPNTLNWSGTTEKLSKRGDWTVQVIGHDDAGYQTAALTTGFYIGKPDLALSALSLPSICYVGYNTTVTAYIRAFNTTVEHVNVAFRVDNVNTSIQQDLTIQKDENRTLQFFWLPGSKGTHNVSVVLYYSDSNPGNNRRWKVVTVEAVPDLGILNVSVTPIPVDEGDPVKVTVFLNNTGDGNATNYKVVLYCEQNENNYTMYFLDEKNSTTVSLKKNEYKNVTLTWEQTRYGRTSFKGEWAVGIQILNTTQTPDNYGANNYKTLFHVLRVTPAERNPPVLSNLEYPSVLELGNPVLIRVKATDASGVSSVVLSIKTPNRTFVNVSMTSLEDNRYEYLFNATQLGRHNFSIKATDLSPNKNQSITTGFFEVTGDRTPPTITYYGVSPLVQLRNDQVEIRCIITDFSGIQSVQVVILLPDNLSETHVMSSSLSDAKYIYKTSYESCGKYVFWITAEDTKGNKKTTEEKTFWITNALNDTDSDGMPDAWEEGYGLNPYDPTDASRDTDNDGVSNLEEYKAGTNPTKQLSSPSEFFVRLRDNWAYLVASIIVCVIIVFLARYGIRRRKQ
jgi:hypothetical protein